jgi:hypothetical protein
MILRTLLIVAAAGTMWGCYVDVSDIDDNWHDKREAVCARYCSNLASCETIDWNDFDECTDRCEDAYDDDHAATRDACACVEDAECTNSLDEVRRCGAPDPA